MMNRWAIVFGALATGLLAGCNATQQLADETTQARKDFVEGAKQEIQSAVPTDVQKHWDTLRKKGPEMAAAVTQVEQITRSILEGHGIAVPQREWVEQQLKSQNPDLAKMMQPLVQLTATEVPAAREWAQGIIDQQLTTAKGDALTGWQKVKAAVDQALAGGN